MAAARRVTFGLLAATFGAAAAFHLAAALRPAIDPTASPPRHAAFVAVNLACALGFVVRPKWFVFAFGALVAQQLVSHGGQAWREWQGAGRVDVASLGVLAIMPLALWLLVADARPAARG
ncbi:MAG TPA: hypothetical protein VFS00_24185 [Polyangiaceae bacterium]|nr:hypothetical protein [Polyangiaceae bacterium]